MCAACPSAALMQLQVCRHQLCVRGFDWKSLSQNRFRVRAFWIFERDVRLKPLNTRVTTAKFANSVTLGNLSRKDDAYSHNNFQYHDVARSSWKLTVLEMALESFNCLLVSVVSHRCHKKVCLLRLIEKRLQLFYKRITLLGWALATRPASARAQVRLLIEAPPLGIYRIWKTKVLQIRLMEGDGY